MSWDRNLFEVLPDELLIHIYAYLFHENESIDTSVALVSKKSNYIFKEALRKIKYIRFSYDQKVLIRKSQHILKMCPSINTLILNSVRVEMMKKIRNILSIFKSRPKQIKKFICYKSRILTEHYNEMKDFVVAFEHIEISELWYGGKNCLPDGFLLKPRKLRTLILQNVGDYRYPEVIAKYDLECLVLYGKYHGFEFGTRRIDFRKLKNLKRLTLTQLKDFDGYLVYNLAENCRKLIHVNLSLSEHDVFNIEALRGGSLANPERYYYPEIDVELFKQLVMNNPNLTKIDFSLRKIVDDRILEAIAISCKNIREINLERCSITGTGLQYLSGCDKLEKLNVKGIRNVGDADIVAINGKSLITIIIDIEHVSEPALMNFFNYCKIIKNVKLYNAGNINNKDCLKYILTTISQTVVNFYIDECVVGFGVFKIILETKFPKMKKLWIDKIVFQSEENKEHKKKVKFFFTNARSISGNDFMVSFSSKHRYYAYDEKCRFSAYR